MLECRQGVCEVFKLPVLGLRPGFDPLVFGFSLRTGFIYNWIKDCSYVGFTIDLKADLESFDHNHWRTYLFVLTVYRPSTCMTIEMM